MADTSGAALETFAVNGLADLEVVAFDGGLGTQYIRDAEANYTGTFPAATVSHTDAQDIRGLLEDRFAAGNPPDLVDNTGPHSIATATLAATGQLADLRTLLNAPSYDDPTRTVAETLIPTVIDKGRFGGDEVWALNYAYTVFGIWHSRTLLEQHGWQYPRSWDEMLALCAAAKAEGIAGWTYAGRYPYYLQWGMYPLIAKIGGVEVLKAMDNLEPGAWQHDAVRTAFESFHELAAKGYVLPGTPDLDHVQSQAAWARGEALFIPNGSWLEGELGDATPPGFGMAVAPTPGLDHADAMPFETIWAQAGEAFVVPSKAANPAGAMELLRMMLSRGAAQNFTRLMSALTVVRGATDGTDLPSGISSASALAAAAGTNIICPRTDWYQDLNRETIAGLIGEMMAGRLKPAETIARIQRAADDVARDDSIQKFRHG